MSNPARNYVQLASEDQSAPHKASEVQDTVETAAAVVKLTKRSERKAGEQDDRTRQMLKTAHELNAGNDLLEHTTWDKLKAEIELCQRERGSDQFKSALRDIKLYYAADKRNSLFPVDITGSRKRQIAEWEEFDKKFSQPLTTSAAVEAPKPKSKPAASAAADPHSGLISWETEETPDLDGALSVSAQNAKDIKRLGGTQARVSKRIQLAALGAGVDTTPAPDRLAHVKVKTDEVAGLARQNIKEAVQGTASMDDTDELSKSLQASAEKNFGMSARAPKDKFEVEEEPSSPNCCSTLWWKNFCTIPAKEKDKDELAFGYKIL